MFNNRKDLTNVLSILVYCAHDNTFLLLLDEERGDYWIPSTKMDDKNSWKDNLKIFKKKLFDYEIINEKLLKILKIWTLEKDYFHIIFQVNLPKEVKTNCKTQTQFGKVVWCSCTQIAKLKSVLRSLEILEITLNYTPKMYRQTEKVSGEIVPMGPLSEIREVDILLNAENCENQAYVDLLECAGIPVEGNLMSKSDVQKDLTFFISSNAEQYDLYEDYLIHTYPCIYMNLVAFKKCTSRFSFSGDYKCLFKAADVWKRDFLTFQDYLLMIAVMDPYTAHYGNLAELRCQYIFRYYDENNSGKIDYSNLKRLITDILLVKNKKAYKTEVEKQIEAAIKLIGFKSNSLMTFSKFYSYVLQSKIRDTSSLLRFGHNHCDVPLSLIQRDSLHQSPVPSKITLLPISFSQSKDNDFEYKIELKTTLLKPEEFPLQIKDLRFLEDTMTKSVVEDFKISSNIKLMRIDSYDLDMKINELLLALRYFCTKICQSTICCGEFEFQEKEAYNWGAAYLEKLGITLMMMCEQMKEILSCEPRLLEIEPPVYVMGDLHGNFHDLMCFEKTLWSNGLNLAPAKLLFLGDYVDRGLNSLEVIMYLFANKIQNPNKLYLIRGNHEMQEIQKLFTFQRECTFKLGLTLGMSVWKAVNEVFDVMPLASVVDRKVFCCHGGIPPPWLCPVISVINTIQCPLVNCERQSPLAWTLMWNDPIKNAFRDSVQKLELLTNEGFIPNVQRGTGFAFSCDALEKFLTTNKLDYVVRAHEVVRAGFQVHQKGKLLTVFSSSGYCGGKNFAASVLVADKILRVFMVDTNTKLKKEKE